MDDFEFAKPLGLCLTCLLDHNKPNQPAEVLIDGTGYCQLHAREETSSRR